MGSDGATWLSLLAASIVHRPYVYTFLAVFLLLAGRDLGWLRMAGWLGWGFLVAFTAEYWSTRIGIPFGLYHYTGATAGREFFISNVPFFDPLSFPFLAYASYCLARWALRRSRGWQTVVLAGVLMTGLDVVIDPLAVRGDRWFLGRVFHYAEPGIYFGVPFSNFTGWALVGALIAGGYLWVLGRRAEPRSNPAGGIGLYYGVLCFNLATTGLIGEWTLLGAGILVHVAVILIVYRLRVLTATRTWMGAPRWGTAAPSPTTLTDKGGL
jgi:uncharacterized membrane protein